MDTSLSLSKVSLESIVLHPNPSKDFIKISGLKSTEDYRIYNILGAQVSSGIVSNNTEIDVRGVSRGLYFLKFNNGNAVKFLKE